MAGKRKARSGPNTTDQVPKKHIGDDVIQSTLQNVNENAPQDSLEQKVDDTQQINGAADDEQAPSPDDQLIPPLQGAEQIQSGQTVQFSLADGKSSKGVFFLKLEAAEIRTWIP